MPSQKQTCNLYKRLCPNDFIPWWSEESFYAQLRSVISDAPDGDRLVPLGDFNARVGNDHETGGPTLGRFGRGKQNQNGKLLACSCTELGLAITNTYFQHRDRHFLLVDSTDIQAPAPAELCCRKRTDLKDIKNTRAMRGPGCEPTITWLIRPWTSLWRYSSAGRRKLPKYSVGGYGRSSEGKSYWRRISRGNVEDHAQNMYDTSVAVLCYTKKSMQTGLVKMKILSKPFS